ncbi:lysoplasmalogenase family protein [Ornithinimicrobium avium]|uniref:Lysoplasmalogenase n=1 Tax=Ornithinimicrobium avium TaxID=2283195 RepID=A0A345NKK4_9MICO|nr:lysoplasmalogenase family protein [Ornithinimicrobium avium]AXH95562.1 lysoplasmalogenase [Ornithinimicrobium avium]
MPSRTPALLAAALLAGVVNVAAAFLGMDPLARVAQWLYLPPLALALVQSGWLHTRLSRWWLAGLALCWLGDGLGWLGFEVLLGLFLLGHVAYLVGLLPTWRRSWALRPRGLLHVALLVVGLLLVAPLAGSLVAVVVAYGIVLTAVALLATAAGWPGVAGGLLFMVSDLSLAWLRFSGSDLGDGWRSLVVIGTYVPAQALLLVGVLRLGTRHPHAEERSARRSTA